MFFTHVGGAGSGLPPDSSCDLCHARDFDLWIANATTDQEFELLQKIDDTPCVIVCWSCRQTLKRGNGIKE
jgi:hypothetical protein